MSTLLQKYQYNVLNKPVRTFAMQSSFMMSLGDIVSQQLIEKKGLENHDIYRTLRMTLYGATIGGPVSGTWFNYVNSAIKIKSKWKATIARVTVDQLVFSPFILAVFMGGISILEGRTAEEIKEKYKSSYFTGLMNAYRFWPFVNLFTFACIPVHYRPIVNSSFGLIWNSYLSHLNQKATQALQNNNASATTTATATNPQQVIPETYRHL